MQVTSLDTLLSYAFEKGFFNGAWLYKKNGVIVSQGALGIAHPQKASPLTLDSRFDIASISKQFTAAAILLLRDRGLLSLDDTLETFFPRTAYPGIEVRNLLNHTSGLPDCTNWLDTLIKSGGVHLDNGVIERFLTETRLPMQFAPGTQWAYCNTGYCALARIVEKVSGTPFAQFLQHRLFVPCGMTQTALVHPYRDGTVPQNLAYGMVLEDGQYWLPRHSKKEAYVVSLDGIEGDGSIITTVGDLLLWDAALRNAVVLSAETQREMLEAARLADGSTYPYGFGWQITQDEKVGKAATHYGRWAGYNGVFSRLVEEDSMIAVLCNQTGCDTMARSETLDAVEQFLRTGSASLPQTLDEKADWSAAGRDTAALQGTYCVHRAEIEALFGDRMTVYDSEGKLMLRLTFLDTVFDSELVPISPDYYMAREGLFQVWFEGAYLRTEQFGKHFIFAREIDHA